MLADRLGARRLTLWAGAAMTIAAFGQALAPTDALLLGARLVFGLGFGIVWTSGLAWLSAVTAAPERARTRVPVHGVVSVGGRRRAARRGLGRAR